MALYTGVQAERLGFLVARKQLLECGWGSSVVVCGDSDIGFPIEAFGRTEECKLKCLLGGT